MNKIYKISIKYLNIHNGFLEDHFFKYKKLGKGGSKPTFPHIKKISATSSATQIFLCLLKVVAYYLPHLDKYFI
jgi:hypothetical protein